MGLNFGPTTSCKSPCNSRRGSCATHEGSPHDVFCYTKIMDTFGGKEILYPGEMNISDDEMKFIELLLNEHFNKVAKLIFKIEHIRGELGEEEKAETTKDDIHN